MNEPAPIEYWPVILAENELILDKSTRQTIWITCGVAVITSSAAFYQFTGAIGLYLALTIGLTIALRGGFPRYFQTRSSITTTEFIPAGSGSPYETAMNNPPGSWEPRIVIIEKESVGCWIAFLSLAVMTAYAARVMQDALSPKVQPSFVLVMPLSWSESRREWTMCAEHRGGPDTLFNVQIDVMDSTLFGTVPLTRFGTFSEIDAVSNSLERSRCFAVSPSKADHQGFLIMTVHRAGRLVEDLRIERTAGAWNYAVTVADQTSAKPGTHLPILIECRDTAFPAGILGDAKLLNPCVPNVVPFH